MGKNTGFVATMQRKNYHYNNYRWHSIFTKKCGNPDLKLIAVIDEIVYWYKPQQKTDPVTGNRVFIHKFPGPVWQTSYAHFSSKFGFSPETVRKKLVILEKMGIAFRELRDIRINGQEYNNRLFIHLSNEFFKSVTGFDKVSHKLEAGQGASSKKLSSNNKEISLQKKLAPSPQKNALHNIDIYNLKNRSIKFASDDTNSQSNFLKNNLKKEKNKDENDNKKAKTSFANTTITGIKGLFFDSPKKLADFYPLSENEGLELQKNSGREFSLNAMNEILLDMSKRLNNRSFYSKKGFMSYMAKVFQYEKRNEILVSNESFRIKANQTDSEKIAKEQEKYLSDIEYSLHVSPEWHFKKRIAARLKRDRAYEFLNAYKSLHVTNGLCKVYLRKTVNLSASEQELILNQIKSTHETINKNGEIEFINKLEFVTPEMPRARKVRSAVDGRHLGLYGKNTETQKHRNMKKFGLWDKCRRLISNAFGIEGDKIDVCWLSKLEVNVDEKAKIIKSRAPSEFYKDWIQQNYGHVIERVAREEGYIFKEIQLKSNCTKNRQTSETL